MKPKRHGREVVHGDGAGEGVEVRTRGPHEVSGDRSRGRLGPRMSARKKLPPHVETEILTRSRRKCCLCYFLDRDDGVKQGQIAHLDDDPGNNDPDNLCFLCLPHHDAYDSTTRQSKGYKEDEVKLHRNRLYEHIVLQDAAVESGSTSPEAVGAVVKRYEQIVELRENDIDMLRAERDQQAQRVNELTQALARMEEERAACGVLVTVRRRWAAIHVHARRVGQLAFRSRSTAATCRPSERRPSAILPVCAASYFWGSVTGSDVGRNVTCLHKPSPAIREAEDDARRVRKRLSQQRRIPLRHVPCPDESLKR